MSDTPWIDPAGDPERSVVPPSISTTASMGELSDSLPRWPLAHARAEEPTLPPMFADADADSLPTYEENPRFVLRDRLAGGGMGEVWSAVQVSLGRTVAVKRLRENPEESRRAHAARARVFRQEARIASLLEHPNIVPVHDLGCTADGSPLLCMKLVEGESWHARLRRDFQELDPETLVARNLPILLAMSQAVAFAHTRGIVHRDLKPGQVMLGAFGEVLLTDWGLAMSVSEAVSAAASGHTPTGSQSLSLPSPNTASSPAGTPSYMAPEQTRRNAQAIGRWTDVYLLGGTLYTILTGTPPHHESTAAGCIARAAEGDVTPPAERAPGRYYPDGLVAICMRALANEPADRYPDAQAFLEDLRAYLSGSEAREKSRALIEEAARIAHDPTSDYFAVDHALATLDRAAALWPDNPRLTGITVRLLSNLAEAATASGDFQLAGLAIERLPEGEDRACLAHALAAAQTTRQRAARERRALRWAALALLLIVVTGGVWFGRRLEVQRLEAIEAGKRADAARGRAEDLAGFLIGDLRDRLESIGRVEILAAVAEAARLSIDDLPGSESRTSTALQRLRTAIQLASLHRLRGDLAEGLAILRDQRTAMEGLLRRWPANVDVLQAAAEFELEDAEARRLRGDFAESEAAARQAREYVDRIAGEGMESRHWNILQARTSRALGETLLARGDVQHARDVFTSATLELSPFAQSRTFDPVAYREAVDLHVAIGSSFLSLAEDWAALSQYDRALVYLSGLIANDPLNVQWQSELGALQLHKAEALRRIGAPERSLESASEAATVMRDLTTQDAANARWRELLAEATLLEGEARLDVGDTEVGVARLREALEMQGAIVERDTANAEARRLMARTLARLGQYEYERDEMSAASEYYTRATLAISDVASADMRNLTYRTMLEDYRIRLQDIVAELMLRGQSIAAVEANKIRTQAIEVLIAQEPKRFDLRFDLAMAQIYIVSLGIEIGTPAEDFEKRIGRATDLLMGIHEEDPNNFDAVSSLPTTYALMARLYRDRGRLDDARAEFLKMAAAMDDVDAMAVNSDGHCLAAILESAGWRGAGILSVQLGNVEDARGYLLNSRTALRRCSAILDQAPAAFTDLERLGRLGNLALEAGIARATNDMDAVTSAAEEMLRITDGVESARELDARTIALALLDRLEEAEDLAERRKAWGPYPYEVRIALEAARERAQRNK